MTRIVPAPRPSTLRRARSVLAVVLVSLPAAWAIPAAGQDANYEDVVPASAETVRGLFDVHQVDDAILFEIPDEMLGRDMMIMSRFHRVQAGQTNVGANMSPNLTVRWERRRDRILLRGVDLSTTADPDDNVQIAVDNQRFAPVLASLPIEARGDGSSVVDVTELYLSDTPAFTLPANQRGRMEVRRFASDRSWVEWTRAFPTNVEVRVVQTYDAANPPSTGRGGALSFEVNHSMILLPEEPMQPRLYDERVGFISIQRTNYSRDFDGVRAERYARRYRLEPSDTAAFRRGELVEPVNPWVWYIDPATPEEWIPFVRDGILEWNEGFEEAGFRNAIQVRVAPTEEEDSTFSMLDARYSVVRFVPTQTRSANSGGDVVDPRSGEVLRAHTNLYQGVAERMRWQLLSQVATAAEDPRYRDDDYPLDLMGEAIRYVMSHETAHSVGLPHNQRANFVFPVDSIRDPDFVARMGHSGSSVGRTRFNYTAQAGDGVPPERRMGVWDAWAIRWGYRPILEADSPEAETPILNEWIVERAHLPWFRFASALFGMDVEWDPYRMTEGISDDPVLAAELGMNNLRVMVDSLMPWVLDEGEDYYELETHYLQALTQWNRYAEHAAAAVGGSWTHPKRYGEEGWVYTPIDRDYQLKAMAFLDEHVLQTPTWALNLELLRRIEHAGAVERIRAYQELAIQRFLNHARLARLIEHQTFLGSETYTPTEMLDDVREIVWREVVEGVAIDTYRRNQQRAYLTQAHHLLHEAESESWSPPASGNLRVGRNDDPPLNGDLHIAQSDIHALIRDQLRLLRAEVEAALEAGVDDRDTRIHLEDVLVRIDGTL
jgi:hypothetical protein